MMGLLILYNHINTNCMYLIYIIYLDLDMFLLSFFFFKSCIDLNKSTVLKNKMYQYSEIIIFIGT